jgi:predicted transcriptional regulator
MAIPDSVELAAEVVAAYVANNPLPRNELPALIEAIKSAIEGLGRGLEGWQPQVEAKPPAVPVRKSITPDYLICLEDGKKIQVTATSSATARPYARIVSREMESACKLSDGRA